MTDDIPADDQTIACLWASTFNARESDRIQESLRSIARSYELLARTSTYWRFGESVRKVTGGDGR
jgi:hypothetical protein